MDTSIEKARKTIRGVPWSWQGKCVKCRKYAFYTIKKKWNTPKGIIRARLCPDCARELDMEWILGQMEGRAERERLKRKMETERDKIAEEKFDSEGGLKGVLKSLGKKDN